MACLSETLRSLFRLIFEGMEDDFLRLVFVIFVDKGHWLLRLRDLFAVEGALLDSEDTVRSERAVHRLVFLGNLIISLSLPSGLSYDSGKESIVISWLIFKVGGRVSLVLFRCHTTK